VRYISLTADVAYHYNLSASKGAYIAPTEDGTPSIIPDSPAAKAGLQEKDIITKVNNIQLDERTNLTAALSRFKPGDKVDLSVKRGNKTLHIKVTLGTLPQS
jgi:putative serine protease PepD